GARLLRGSADLPGAHLLDLVATMDRLRVECPWDSRQTHQSLAPHLLEEPYEALEALESGDDRAFCEELGDVLLQVVFHARALAAQLQRRAARAGVPDEVARLDDEPGSSDPADPAGDIGRELFRLVTRAREAGRDPEMDLRAAARRYRDRVRAWERS